MTYFILISAASLLVLVALMWAAPRGWQDENGFHYGEEPHPPLARPSEGNPQPAPNASRRSARSDKSAPRTELAAAE